MAAGNVRGTNWGKAVNWAKQGKYGKAKQQVESGGGTWSTEMHKSLKSTGDYKPPVASETSPPQGDPVEELQQSVDDLVAKMQQQQTDQQAAYQQQQRQFAEQQRIADLERERMRPKDASQALYSTILSGGESWVQRKKKHSNWLKPFASLTPGGSSGIG